MVENNMSNQTLLISGNLLELDSKVLRW